MTTTHEFFTPDPIALQQCEWAFEDGALHVLNQLHKHHGDDPGIARFIATLIEEMGLQQEE